MGCFSYKCLECGRGIRSSSFDGEKAHLFMLKDGKIIEQMTGEYNSYGSVFIDGTQDSSVPHPLRLSKQWKEDVYFYEGQDNPGFGNGLAAVHVNCYKKDPTHISARDPDQGWGGVKRKVKNYEPLKELRLEELHGKIWRAKDRIGLSGLTMGWHEDPKILAVLEKQHEKLKEEYLEMTSEYARLNGSLEDWMDI